jgi:hypothetical protein
MCKPPEETLEHLLFYCDFSKECWQTIDMQRDNICDRLHIIEDGKQRWDRPLFMETFLLVAWNIWKEKNNHYYQGVDPSIASWKERLKSDLTLLVHRTKESLHSDIWNIGAKL